MFEAALLLAMAAAGASIMLAVASKRPMSARARSRR